MGRANVIDGRVEVVGPGPALPAAVEYTYIRFVTGNGEVIHLNTVRAVKEVPTYVSPDAIDSCISPTEDPRKHIIFVPFASTREPLTLAQLS